MDELLLKVAHEAATTSRFSVGFGLIAGAGGVVACDHLGIDHYITAFIAVGAFQIAAKVGRKIDEWWK